MRSGIEALWPDRGAAAAANNLRQPLFVARRALDCSGVDGARAHAAARGASAARASADVNAFKDFWRRSDVELDGARDLQQAVRFNLLQRAGHRALGGPRRAAKGLTGRGYEGRCFWDTEIYVVPFPIHTNP